MLCQDRCIPFPLPAQSTITLSFLPVFYATNFGLPTNPKLSPTSKPKKWKVSDVAFGLLPAMWPSFGKKGLLWPLQPVVLFCFGRWQLGEKNDFERMYTTGPFIKK